MPEPRTVIYRLSLEKNRQVLDSMEDLTAIGVALSQEKDLNRLLEAIVDAAKHITHADGGTLYRKGEDNTLSFEILRTDSLNLKIGGTTGTPAPFNPIPLYGPRGEPNHSMIASYCALTGETVNIADARSEQGFDFSGTREFDQKTGYRSISFLTVPLRDHQNEIIGILQLINHRDPESGEVSSFSEAHQRLAESLASQAAISLTNRLLIQQLETLFESLVKLINTAIDEKSPYTGGHCDRVPELTMMIAEAAHEAEQGPLKHFRMSDADRYELKIASLLHDCGKITTPVHVVDKATKLEAIYDRIGLIDTRFEVAKRDLQIEMLTRKLRAHEKGRGDTVEEIDAAYAQQLAQLEDDCVFLHRCNRGSEERMPEADRERVRQIGRRKWLGPDGKETSFLSENEVENLTIPYGTLTAGDRAIINHHIVATIKMLESLPWPRHLKNVPEYAGGHHERMDGKGYPRGLTGDQMSLQARMMAIADIFEALTAPDRPYKTGKSLTESLRILGRFALNGHIDRDLFDLFVREKIYMRYAQKYLDPKQVDEVEVGSIPGYRP